MTRGDIEAPAASDQSEMQRMAREVAVHVLPACAGPDRIEDFVMAYEVGFTMGLKKFSRETEITWRRGVFVGFVRGCLFTLALCLIVFWPWLSPR
jgi:hypothetical protein